MRMNIVMQDKCMEMKLRAKVWLQAQLVCRNTSVQMEDNLNKTLHSIIHQCNT